MLRRIIGFQIIEEFLRNLLADVFVGRRGEVAIARHLVFDLNGDQHLVAGILQCRARQQFVQRQAVALRALGGKGRHSPILGHPIRLERRERDLFVPEVVVSKFSCGFPVVEFQQASQPLARLDFASRFTDSVFRPREKNHIPFPLVISLTVKMKNVI